MAGNKGILVEQGKRFGISFECLDQNGRVCKNGKYWLARSMEVC